MNQTSIYTLIYNANCFIWLRTSIRKLSSLHIEIKSDWVRTETEGADIVIRYIMPETREINIALTFSGTNDNTRVAGRLLIQKPDGSLADDGYKFVDGCTASKDWSYDLNGVTVEKGNFISVVLHNEGTGYGQGHFSMNLTATGSAPTETEIANYFEDFGNEDVWAYGYSTDYQWDTNNFTFNKLTADGEGNYTSIDGDNKLEIKKDFVLSEYGGRDLAIGYKVPAGQSKLKVNVDFAGSNEETQIAPRILVVRGGATQSAEFFGDCENKQNWNITHEVNVAEGDIIYVILFPKADTGYKHGKLQITINGKAAQQPGPENVITNFNEDFAGTLAGTSNWEVGVVDYKFPEETFTFTKITNKNDGGDAFTDNTGENWKEIKGDWAAINGMVAFRYKFDNAVNAHVNFQIKGTGSNQYNIRWAITDSEGNVKNDGNKPAWVGGGNDVTLDTDVTAVAGDIFYIFIERNAEIDGDQCTYSLVITGEAQQPATSFEGANFADDFHDNTVTESNWEYGSANYGWDGNHSIKANAENLFVAGFIGTPAMNFLYGKLEEDGFALNGCDQKLKMLPGQMELLKNYVGHGLVYGIRPENLIFEQDERFERYKNTSFEMKVGIVELLGDILNVHGKTGNADVIIKMPNKYSVKEGDVIRVAIEHGYERFFNETTTKAITPDYCEYEEVVNTKSLDEDNVTIIEQKKSGLFSKAADAIKNKLKKKSEKGEEKDAAKQEDAADSQDKQ